MKFEIRKIMQYTEVLEIEADSLLSAERQMDDICVNRADEFERIHDDHWHDSYVVEK